jgi:hypothetical protein
LALIDFLATGNVPFTAALVVVAALGIIELASLLIGLSPSAAIDAMLPDLHVAADLHVELDHSPGHFPSLLGWMGLGKVPVLILLVIFLTCFAIAGFGAQALANAALGQMLPATIASAPAAVIGLLGMARIGNVLARLLPKDTSQAASQQELIGSIATVLHGQARAGHPAEAKASDLRGRTHYLLLEPDDGEEVINGGEKALIVRREGAVYRAVTKISDGTSVPRL